MCIHLDRSVCYPFQTSWVAPSSDCRKLRFDLVHLHFHVDDRFGRVEEATVARSISLSAFKPFHSRKYAGHTLRATAASLYCRWHCCGAAVRAFGQRVWGIGTRLPMIGKFVGPALQLPFSTELVSELLLALVHVQVDDASVPDFPDTVPLSHAPLQTDDTLL